MSGRLAYATVGSNQLVAARVFYDALLKVAGIVPMFDHPSGGRIYGRDGEFCFSVLGPYDGGPATPGNGAMVSFRFEAPGEVDAFHAKALALGGRDEGAPGYRGGSPYYMSYFRDLDGNKICGFYIRA